MSDEKPPLRARPRITVLGVGNVLLRDEGLGVRAVERLQEDFSLPPNVDVYDGGTGGLGLLPVVEKADRLIVVDTVLVGEEPGTVVTFDFEDLPADLTRKLSAHDVDIIDVLKIAEALEKRPPTLIVGIQPRDISGPGTEPTDPRDVARLVRAVVEELGALGVTAAPKRRSES